MNGPEGDCSDMIVIWEKPEAAELDENDLSYADAREKKLSENSEVLKQLRERLIPVQWMDEMYRASFENAPALDFVFEAEEIVYDARNQEEKR